MINEAVCRNYLAILKEELVLATGCTEPIAVAYCAAKMHQLLGALPESVEVEVSGNILKNVKSVVVPNTNEMKGIKPAAAVGIVAGDPEKELQVIAEVTEHDRDRIVAFLEKTPIHVACVHTPCLLDITVTGKADGHSARVRIANSHANIVYMEKDGQVLMEREIVASAEDNLTDKSLLNIQDILEFADTVPMDALRPILQRQIEFNSAIAEEGIQNCWGAQIGRILLTDYGDDIKQEAKAYAAAGSDARMSGCEKPVVILSGSGNQGITASVPLIRYAKHLHATQEQLYRALAVSDLVTIHQKTGIGRLSAYCGAVSAGVGVGAGICYLHGGRLEAVAHTIVNAVAILSGTICDGAKPSCAAKIAAAVDAGIIGYEMYLHNTEFHRGEGIVGSSVEQTILNVGTLASQGMRDTDYTILHIMQGQC